MTPPHKVLVLSGHTLGKTFLAAALSNWFFDNFDPGVLVTTAPTAEHVKNILWKEIRVQRWRAGLEDHFIGPAAPEMRTNPDHYGIGLTASKGEGFQGRHDLRMFFVFDEAAAIPSIYWTTVKTMHKAELGHFWLAIGNPTDTTSPAYLEASEGDWQIINLSSLDHPNIAAEIEGRPLPVPSAVSVSMVNQWFHDWTEPVELGDRQTTDLEWPPNSGLWHRPGPSFESRVLGRWPSAGTYGVWSDYLWSRCESARLDLPHPSELPQFGCDVARFGDDLTTIHGRWGGTSLHHERHNGWATTKTAARLRNLADAAAQKVNERRNEPSAAKCEGREIPMKVDDTGVGGGVTDLLRKWGYKAIAVQGGQLAARPEKYPNKRSELWFETADKARQGYLDLHVLPRDVRRILKKQAMAPEWSPDAQDRRVVEPREITKEKIGHSPDDLDAMNLAFYDSGTWEPPATIPEQEEPNDPYAGTAAERYLRRMR